MGWDAVLSGWDQALDEIDRALADGDWEALEGIRWPENDDDLDEATAAQRRAARELSRRQLVAITAVREMLEDVGRELRDAVRFRGAVKAYRASERSVASRNPAEQDVNASSQ